MLANTLETRAIIRSVIGTSFRGTWTDAAKDKTKRLVAYCVTGGNLSATRKLVEAAFRKAGFDNTVKATISTQEGCHSGGDSYIRVVASFNRFARF